MLFRRPDELFIAFLLAMFALMSPTRVFAQHQGDHTENAPEIKHRVMEAYPSALLASIEHHNRMIDDRLESDHGMSSEFVMTNAAQWPQHATVTVAFLDGDKELHKAVADTAMEWCKYCNIKLDFGLNSATGEFRRWTINDQTRTADIRISFDRIGYYSLVGTDSRNPQIGNPADPDGGRPNQRSMNFEGFTDGRPDDFAGVVLHEFGHALGLQHEHQHPTQGCESEFRWADDHGYVPTRDQHGQFIKDSHGRRPGIYTVLGGPPNKWPKSVVDFNLRQLTDAHAYTFSSFDRDSIMKYFFEDWMFNGGTSSHCFSAGENVKLSPTDKLGIWNTYPTSSTPPAASVPETTGEPEIAPAQRVAQSERRRAAAIKQLLKATDESQKEVREHYKSLQPE